MKLYKVDYLGYATADHRLSNPMIPWILAEIRKGTSLQKVSVGVRNGRLMCYSEAARARDPPLMTHPLHLVFRHMMIHGNVTSFGYFLRDLNESILYCYLFQTFNPDDAVDLLAAMRDQANRAAIPPARTCSNAATLTSLCADISPSSSHFFEVLYVGKVKVNQKKVSDTFIDDTLDKFRNYELEKERRNALLNNRDEEASNCQDLDSKDQQMSESPSCPNLAVISPSSDVSPPLSETNKTDSTSTTDSQDEMRARTGSTSSNGGSQKPGSSSGGKVEDNRTMVFQVGHSDLRLISPDRKQVLLHKQIKDIVCCIQGTKHNTHFGFICKEPGVDYNVGYVFKCQSGSVADELVVAISQVHVAVSEAVKKEKQPVLSCDHCPMVWYHKLCADIESQSSDKRVQTCIFRRLELLPEEEQDVVLTKLRGAEALSDTSIKEQNELLMMLLRAHCESKQSRHVHDTAENRHEFLNHYLGSSTIFMKAKRSLTSSFDQLLKRKGSRDDLAPVETGKTIVKELSLPMNAALCKDSSNVASSATTSSSSSMLLEVPQTPSSRPRSSTISSLPDTTEIDVPKSSPMMNIFLKVGNSPKEEMENSNRQSGSWRQAIFNTVVTPNKSRVQDKSAELTSMSRRDKADLRSLCGLTMGLQLPLYKSAELTSMSRRDKADLRSLCGLTMGLQLPPYKSAELTSMSRRDKADLRSLCGLTMGLQLPPYKSAELTSMSRRDKADLRSLCGLTMGLQLPPYKSAELTSMSRRDKADLRSLCGLTMGLQLPLYKSAELTSMSRRDKADLRSLCGLTMGLQLPPYKSAELTSMSRRDKADLRSLCGLTMGLQLPLYKSAELTSMSRRDKADLRSLCGLTMGLQLPPYKSAELTSMSRRDKADLRSLCGLTMGLQLPPYKSAELTSMSRRDKADLRSLCGLTMGLQLPPYKSAELTSMSRRDKADLRSLWRKAINQQVLLIRMEKENARLKARQEEVTMKRIKLEYDDIGALGRQNIEVWEMIINKEARKADAQILTQAIRQGVPRSKRGEIWLYLAERHCSLTPPFDSSRFPNYNTHYDELLKQLTSQQHAILIDLGRTFPSHTYFSSPLGPGQLALYNLLKAYSLLDPEVGYCQGLSFVAGVLLLHMSEDQAFFMLRHLMFRRQLRAQYLPDMVALQVALYQLSRLIHDHHPELYMHLDRHEVAPTLFAAPWLLTVFASQFPLGFVTRVFDLLFLEGKEVLFRVALALLGQHKDGLLACDSFEQIMSYLKATLPVIDKPIMDKILKEVFLTDISKKLLEYEVEYHVLQEEVNTPRPEVKMVKQLEAANKQLLMQNRCLTEQLEIATSNIKRLETNRSTHMLQINRLESQVRSLEVTVTSLGGFISTLAYNNSDLEIPSEILRIIAQINLSERQSLPNNVVRTGMITRSLPLKVLDDNRKSPPKEKKIPPQLKSTFSSPNLQPKSSFFTNSFNQIQQQKLGEHPKISPLNGMKQSLSDSDSLQLLLNSEASKDLMHAGATKLDFPKLGRVLTDDDRKALGLMKEDSESLIKSNSMPTSDGKRKLLKSSQSSYELGKSESASAMSDLPLCSDTVNICFGGTTKLKTIRPLKTRNESCSSILSQSSSAGSLFECQSPNKRIELQIVEPTDTIGSGKPVFDKSPDTLLFGGSLPVERNFEVKGKEAERMIESQVPAKQPSLLT